jgi:uncharacterized membrane protein
MSIYLRVLLLGLATGGRSTVGITALALTTPRTGSWLASRWVARLAGLACAGELAGDKLPQAPSRLASAGLASRLVGGAVGGVLLARRYRGSTATAVSAGLLGVVGAVAGALLGSRWRSLAAGRFGTDLPGALVEDAGWLALAGYAVTGR